MTNIRRFSFNPLCEECSVVWGPGAKDCVIIDPGSSNAEERGVLDGFLTSQMLRPAAILLTHAHLDHICDCSRLQEAYDIPIYLHPDDLPTKDEFAKIAPTFGFPSESALFRTVAVSDGGSVTEAGISFKVIHTPGHSPGSVCYLLEKDGILFSGDTLFAGTIGRTDLPFGDYDRLMRSITDKLMTLPDGTAVLPGHGATTTIADERNGNPLLEPFNIKEEEPDPDAPPIRIHP